MTELQKQQIAKAVYAFASLSNINDKSLCDNIISNITSMDIDAAMDYIIISLDNLVTSGALTKEVLFSNTQLLTAINNEKYKTTDDLLKRLNWLKSMNLNQSKMSLPENHKLVLEAFDEFNALIGTSFDSYYTGGLMGYLATNHELERYHSDLDLFINEEELIRLYKLIKENPDFEFISNLDHKDPNGHEFKIQYKNTPMSIGLFLFERTWDKEIIIKEYYHSNNNPTEELLVNERHLTKDYAELAFSEQIREHNGISYRMQSLESIYNAKKNARAKDRYDANIIKDHVDMLVDYNLDIKKKDNYELNGKKAANSIVAKLETEINSLNSSKHI